jgi:hypothetical protein
LGISPWDYLNRYRLAQAKLLLQTTPDSMQVIARRVGIPDPAYFSRVFPPGGGRIAVCLSGKRTAVNRLRASHRQLFVDICLDTDTVYLTPLVIWRYNENGR